MRAKGRVGHVVRRRRRNVSKSAQELAELMTVIVSVFA